MASAPIPSQALGLTTDDVSGEGAILTEAGKFLRALMMEQRVTEEGVVEQLRTEFSDLESADDYVVPNGVRWELILLMRADGTSVSEIAQATGIDYATVLMWFHTPGVVQDLWNLLQRETWERIKTKMQNRALRALDDERTPAIDAIHLASEILERFSQRRGASVGESPAELRDKMMRTSMPEPRT